MRFKFGFEGLQGIWTNPVDKSVNVGAGWQMLVSQWDGPEAQQGWSKRVQGLQTPLFRTQRSSGPPTEMGMRALHILLLRHWDGLKSSAVWICV